MLFVYTVTVVAHSLEESPGVFKVPICSGVITDLSVQFPPGCHGLVKVRLYYHDQLILPRQQDQWITGNAETVRSQEYNDLEKGPFNLEIAVCSDTCDFDHHITVRITILPRHLASMSPLVSLLTKVFRRMFGEEVVDVG